MHPTWQYQWSVRPRRGCCRCMAHGTNYPLCGLPSGQPHQDRTRSDAAMAVPRPFRGRLLGERFHVPPTPRTVIPSGRGGWLNSIHARTIILFRITVWLPLKPLNPVSVRNRTAPLARRWRRKLGAAREYLATRTIMQLGMISIYIFVGTG